jgi:hypothetical protein
MPIGAQLDQTRNCWRRTPGESGKRRFVTPFGLVLGGGGPIGAAWYAGLASGLADEGFDLGVADVIGTSAGAWAGVWLACERSTEFIDVMNRVAGSRASGHGHRSDRSGVRLDETRKAPLGPPDTQRIGELAMLVPPVGVRFYAKNLPGSDLARAVPFTRGEHKDWRTSGARTRRRAPT